MKIQGGLQKNCYGSYHTPEFDKNKSKKGELSSARRKVRPFFVYRVKFKFSVKRRNPNASPTRKMQFGLSSFGPSDWIRTSGLLNPIQARYQTSPHPDIFFFTAVGVTQAAYIDYHRPQENASLFFNFFNLFFRGNQPVQNSLSPLRRKAFSCCHLQEDREAPAAARHLGKKKSPPNGGDFRKE